MQRSPDPHRRLVTVRTATADDDPRLAALDAAAWPQELQVVPPRPSSQSFFTGSRQVDDVLVAESDGEIAGYAHLARHLRVEANRHVLHLNSIAVSPHARRRGVASALVASCIDEARRRGALKLGLRALSINSSARAMYERFGFVLEGRLRREILSPDGSYADDLWYALFLDESDAARTR